MPPEAFNLLDQARALIRTMHYSIRTQQIRADWARQVLPCFFPVLLIRAIRRYRPLSDSLPIFRPGGNLIPPHLSKF